MTSDVSFAGLGHVRPTNSVDGPGRFALPALRRKRATHNGKEGPRRAQSVKVQPTLDERQHFRDGHIRPSSHQF